MKTEVLLKLIEAGYTKDEIALMEEVEPKAMASEEIPASEEQNESAEAEPTDPKTDPSIKMNETINDIMSIITKMQKTLDGLQHKNAKSAESGTPAKLTADDVVKSFFGNTKKAQNT